MATEESSAVLKKQRAVIKGSCTRIRTYVDSITNINPSIIAQLEERKLKLDQHYSEYNSVQSRLEILEEAEANDRGAFEEAFFALSAKIRETVNPARPPRSANASTASVSSYHENSNTVNNVRLPKLELPNFSGKYDEWFPFFDTFHLVIHNNASLSNIQRFQYLKASVTGDASTVINSLEISEANYEVAWTLLKQRYDNKRVIVQNHIQAIMELPSMTKENGIELRQIADGATKHLHALQALKRPTAHWDDLLVHILSSKIDSLSLREWQSSLTGTEVPTLKQFFDFITQRCQMLEATNKSNAANSKATAARPSSKSQSSHVSTVKPKCIYCQGEHSIYYCKDFLALSIPRRISEIRSRHICFNCLRSTTHNSSNCTSGSCKVCQAKHNTLLHVTKSTEPSDGDKNGDESKSTSTPAVLVTHASRPIDGSHIILSTAVVYAYDNKGSRHSCRVLLDCGSQAHFISKKFLTILGLKPRSLNVSITGVSGTATTSTQAVQVKLQSRQDSYAATIECIVADRVTDKLPAFTLKRSDFEFPHNINLADPQFNVSSDIDILIGAGLFWDLLCVGQIQASHNRPLLQKTRLGWILAGPLGNPSQSTLKLRACHASLTNIQLHEQLSRFWRLDDPDGSSNDYTLEERMCKQHFLNNVSQTPQGRYVVKLPVKEHIINKLGDSRAIALSRLKGLERRFQRDPELIIQYSQFIDEYLALGHIRRIIAYCLRFNKAHRPSTPSEIITASESKLALRLMCKVVQKQAFSSEYKALSQGNPISTSSSLLLLTPYMDETGLIRVGGRLKNSNLQVDACHPILLPRSHHLTRHIIEYEHVRNMHPGAQATMAAIRQRFWPLSLRSTVRRVILRCVTCFKAKPLQSEAMMGSLPSSRVTASRPFSHAGIDYAGPVILREGKRRNARNHKAYIAILVCFATKAIHIELVSDLTSDAFLAAFKRFISRRGKPSHMYSDNGTTFVGAQKQLKELYDFYFKQTTMSQIEQFCSDQEISWNFIPPNAPHFGGLWEAAVKSAKFHMTRIVGKAHLTFEEMQTVLCEIEAILNSRPLTQLSSDPNDLTYLTPGHFLIGTALNSFPCSDFTDVNENRLLRWQRVEQIRQHFWRRWSYEYLHSLQERCKWRSNKGIQLEPNQLVLIKQQNLAPLQWILGRVQEVHPGSDNIARTATIKTSKSSFVRPLSKLAILPIDSPSVDV